MPQPFPTVALATFVTCNHTSRVYPPGSVLFSEGEVPEGVHILDSGQAKLFGSTSRGKTVITKIARAGELLGLNAVILGRPYLVSAEVTEPSRVSHVRGEDFMAFLRKSPEAANHVIKQLSTNYYDAEREVRTLNLASNAGERVARLLLGWVEESEERADDEVWINMDLTQEQVAQMLGASRETVSRVTSTMARQGIIEIKGHVLRIPSVSRLRDFARL
jgi:CRP-like cAMP-binding protein